MGVFMPIMVMGLAIRQHLRKHFTGRVRTWGARGAAFAAALAGIVFVGQIVGKWAEGGWVVLISFSLLALTAHLLLLSPLGYRGPRQIQRIVRKKARVQGHMASIVEWQSLRMQEYRYSLLTRISRFFAWFGVYRPRRYAPRPVMAGDYETALHGHPEDRDFLESYLRPKRHPHLGGAPNQTEAPEEAQVPTSSAVGN